MEVLQQGVAQEVLVSRRSDDCGDQGVPERLDGPPAALPGHEDVRPSLGVRAHDHGLEQPDGGDGGSELGQGLLVEDLARLAGVGPDPVHGDLRVPHAGEFRGPPGRPGSGGSRRTCAQFAARPVASLTVMSRLLETAVDNCAPVPGPPHVVHRNPVDNVGMI